MKKIIAFLFLLYFSFVSGQTEKVLKNSIEKLSEEYLTEMYIKKNFDFASKMWENGMLTEMKSFYSKNGYEDLTDSILKRQIKSDVEKYYKKLAKFKVNKILDTEIQKENGNIFGQVFFQYSETLKNKTELIKTMLVFISYDNGKTWFIQDWKIKPAIAQNRC